MNATIARLHSFDPAAIGLGDFGRGENYVARQVERWSKQYRASETERIDEMERLIAWLPAHLPPPAPVRLVHGDYRLDNIILAQSEPKMLAVLDWELSTLGDPLADLAYHLMQWDDAAVGDHRRRRHACSAMTLRRLGIPVALGLCGRLCGAHRARPTAASLRLSRLQFLPPRRDPAGHRRTGARRHRDQARTPPAWR